MSYQSLAKTILFGKKGTEAPNPTNKLVMDALVASFEPSEFEDTDEAVEKSGIGMRNTHYDYSYNGTTLSKRDRNGKLETRHPSI